MNSITRRQFLESSILAAAAAASVPAPLLAAEQRAVSANDKITVAIVGCGIRGKQHADELARLSDCEIAYVCDPDRDRAAEVAAHLGAEDRCAAQSVRAAVGHAPSRTRRRPAAGWKSFAPRFKPGRPIQPGLSRRAARSGRRARAFPPAGPDVHSTAQCRRVGADFRIVARLLHRVRTG